MQAWRRTHADRGRWNQEFRIVPEDGDARWVQATGMPRYDDEGRFLGYIGTMSDATDLHQTQRELQAITDRFKAFFQHSPTLKWAVDENDVLVFMNPAFADLFGISVQDAVGRTQAEVFTEIAGEAFTKRMQETDEQSRKEGTLHLELDLQLRDREVSLYMSKFTFVDQEKNIVVGGSANDMTSLKRYERDLHQANERLRLALAGSNAGLWDWDLKTDEAYFSEVYYTMLGYDPGELPMHLHTWQSLVHPDDAEEVNGMLTAYVNGEDAEFRCPHRLRCKDGSWKWVDYVGEITERDEQGSPVRMTGLLLDIDKLKRTQQELEQLNTDLEERVRKRTAELLESEQRFQAAADSAPIMMWMHDAEGNLGWCNKGWLEFAGCTQGEMLGDGWIDFIHPNDRKSILDSWKEVFESRAKWDYDFRARRSDGEYRWMYVHGMPHYDANDNFEGYIGTMSDATERREAEDKLRDAHDELEVRVEERTGELKVNLASLAARNRELDQFAHAASHDLRSPLRTILGFAEHLRYLRDEDCGEEERDALDRIESAARRMSNLIDSLLMFATVGRGELDMQEIEVSALISQICSDLAEEIETASAEVKVPDNLPQIVGDPQMIRQVFQNLISNAIKYRRDEPPIVEIRADVQDEHFEFSVTDNGTGLKTDDIRRAFEPFQRLHIGREHRGTGIGLSICQRVVQRHGGEIRAESAPGVGSTFTFTLPKAEANE